MNVSYEEELLKQLQDDPEYADEYLKAALEEDDPGVFLLAVKDVIQARGGMSEIAEKTDLNRVSLYRTLTDEGNPAFRTIDKLLHALGYRFSIQKVV